ncbi:MAG: MazG nucleotide pyrophosphohydrolase domain-containing protein [Stenotrophobium sp.]
MPDSDPLDEALRMQLAAARLGFDWRETAELWDKLAEEIGELQEAMTEGPERIRDELGDLLFMVVNLARHLHTDPALALSGANQKFNSRFNYIAQHIDKLPEIGDPRRLDAMEKLWQDAKRLERMQDRAE